MTLLCFVSAQHLFSTTEFLGRYSGIVDLVSLEGMESGVMSPELLTILGRYKFHVSIENYPCEDYLTEKLWRPLIVGSVPIYFGSPSVRVSSSVIYALQFSLIIVCIELYLAQAQIQIIFS